VTPDEVVSIIRMIRAACPQQAASLNAAAEERIPGQDYPPLVLVWQAALAGIDPRRAAAAIPVILRDTKWIGPTEIVQYVRADTLARLRQHNIDLTPLDVDRDDPDAYRAALTRRRVALVAQVEAEAVNDARKALGA
jgi:hypothetical protein